MEAQQNVEGCPSRSFGLFLAEPPMQLLKSLLVTNIVWEVKHLALMGDFRVSVSALWRFGGLPIITACPPLLRLGGDLTVPTPALHPQL